MRRRCHRAYIWLAYTNMLLRRTVIASSASAVVVHIGIDNDVKIWLNGALFYTATHEGCAVLDNFNIPVPPGFLVDGVNLIAIQAIDRGGSTPPPPRARESAKLAWVCPRRAHLPADLASGRHARQYGPQSVHLAQPIPWLNPSRYGQGRHFSWAAGSRELPEPPRFPVCNAR